MADPAFMQKLVLEQMITIGTALAYEAKVSARLVTYRLGGLLGGCGGWTGMEGWTGIYFVDSSWLTMRWVVSCILSLEGRTC